MVALSPTPSFPGAWPDLSSSDLVPPLPDQPSQDISPSLVCLSPRPVPELPSLSSSLSTADSTVTSRSPTPPEQSASPVEEQLTCTPPLQTDSPVVLDLREPRSPDSAHFSPPDDTSSFSSPSSSRIQLSVSNNCPGTQSVESVATYLPSISRASTPDAEHGELQEEESRPDPPVEETTNLGSNVNQQAANVSVDKRTFLGRVKRFGGRVRKLFKPRVVETKPRRSGIYPRKPSLTVNGNVRLPTADLESRQNLEVPTILPRRFSLQSLLHPRPPIGSVNSSSRNRLPTIVSAPDDDWLSPLDMHSADDEAQDNQELKAEATTVVRHGLGIKTADELISGANRD